MPRLELKRILLASLAVATVLGLFASLVVDKALARFFRLPADASLLDLEPLEPGEPPPQPERTVPEPPAPRVAADPEVAKLDWVTPIVKRSLFDSSKVDQGLDPNASTEDCPKTDLNLVLYATIVAEPETFSSALIGEEKSDSFPTGYGIGDEVLGKEVYKIEQKKVVFNVGGSLECLTVAGEDVVRVVHKDNGEGVSSDGENKFTVDQSLLDELLANPEALATQIRAVPHKGADGNVDGYRLSGIRKGSAFEQLGVKNGDIIHSVNGKDLTNVSNAMDAYSSLQTEKAFSFDVTRKNQRQTMQYDVR